MRDDILKFIAPREERIDIGGVSVVVRELSTAAEAQSFKGEADAIYNLIVLCVFDETGNPVFTNDDIPALKAASRVKMMPIMSAVHRVMGFDIGEEVKNSGADPSAG